jgi:tRNA-dihydrouridine synthase 1
VTCKIRIFPDIQKTIQYAKMLEEAGCQLLTVHGRVREQRGVNTGLADWNQIKAVKDHVKIPVIANGNVLHYDDIEKCLEYTGVEAVMTAEGNLHNPALFEKDVQYNVCSIAEEYLSLCSQYPTPISSVRAHLFKLWIKCLPYHTDLREDLAKAKKLTEIVTIASELKQRLKKEEEEYIAIGKKSNRFEDDQLPHWICQTYVRKDRAKKVNENSSTAAKDSTDKDLDEAQQPLEKKLKISSDQPI